MPTLQIPAAVEPETITITGEMSEVAEGSQPMGLEWDSMLAASDVPSDADPAGEPLEPADTEGPDDVDPTDDGIDDSAAGGDPTYVDPTHDDQTHADPTHADPTYGDPADDDYDEDLDFDGTGPAAAASSLPSPADAYLSVQQSEYGNYLLRLQAAQKAVADASVRVLHCEMALKNARKSRETATELYEAVLEEGQRFDIAATTPAGYPPAPATAFTPSPSPSPSPATAPAPTSVSTPSHAPVAPISVGDDRVELDDSELDGGESETPTDEGERETPADAGPSPVSLSATSGTTAEPPRAVLLSDAAWRNVRIETLGLKPSLAELLVEAGLDTIGKLEDQRADSHNGGLRAIKGVGQAKADAIEDAVLRWLSSNRDAAVLAAAGG